MRVTTSLLSLLFSLNQPLSEARKVAGDVLLELLESRLDEGLSYLEGDGPRLARKELQIVRKHGSVREFVQEVMSEETKAPEVP